MRRVVAVATAALAALVFTSARGRPAPLRVSLETVAVQEGRTLVALQVRGIPDGGIAAFQVRLDYDPERLELRDPNQEYTAYGVPAFAPLGGSPACATVRASASCADPHWLLTASGRQPLGRAEIDPDEGSLLVAYATSGQRPPVAGDGALLIFEVSGMRRWRRALTIGELILADGSDPPERYTWRLRRR